MQTFAAHMESLPATDRDAIRGAVQPEVWASIEGTNPFGWIPASTNLVCTRAVAARLGPRRTQQFFAGLMLSSFETALMKGLVAAVVRVAGRDFAQYLGWVSKGFGLMYKDCGDWAVTERAQGSATLEVRRLPPDFALDRVWLESSASALGALFTLVRIEGAVVLREVDAREGRAAFKVRWSEERARDD